MARIRTFLLGALAIGLALTAIFPATQAMAQAVAAVVQPEPGTTTVVEIPIGGWFENTATWVGAILFPAIWGFILFMANRFFPPLVALLKTAQVEQLLQKGIDFGIAAAVGATKDKKLSIDVGNEVIAQALNYIIAQAPAKIIAWVGGPDAIRRMIFARLQWEAEVSADAVGVYAPVAST